MKRRRIKRKDFRRRLTAAVILALLVIVFVGSFCIQPKSARVYEAYIIRPGDTLYMLVKDIYGDSCDLRYKINEIAKESGISNPDMIHPGDVVLLPVE